MVIQQERGLFCSIEGNSAGKRGSRKEKGNLCSIYGKSAGKRKVLQYRREVCRKIETSAI
jgi:hypothetical protein